MSELNTKWMGRRYLPCLGVCSRCTAGHKHSLPRGSHPAGPHPPTAQESSFHSRFVLSRHHHCKL